MSESNILFEYNRLNAIQDGIFVDISEEARNQGIKFDVSVTRNIYDNHIRPGQDGFNDRLHKLVNALSAHMSRFNEDYLIEWNMQLEEKNITIWAAQEANSSKDPTISINILLPEDY